MAPTFFPDNLNVGFFLNLDQKTTEWLELRKNKVTGTTAWKLLQGESIEDILLEKENEKDFLGNKYTERGILLEGEARKLYEDLNNVEVLQVGAVINKKYPQYLSSPDGIIPDKKIGIEIKCLTEKNQQNLLTNLDPHYIAQIYFNLFLTEYEAWDLVAYNPEIEDISKAYATRRFYPDKIIFQKFLDALENTPENPEIKSAALQIINLEAQIQSQSDEIKQAIRTYTETKNQIAQLKDWLKNNSKGKIKHIYEDSKGNKLDVSIYDTNRVSVVDEDLVPTEYITPVELKGVYQTSDGKFFKNEPNTKLVNNLYKTSGKLPKGFTVKTSRSISIKFNGETL